MVTVAGELGITMLVLAQLIRMSLKAGRRHANRSRLPMQWSLSGSVNWTAPRRYALAFTPALAALVLSGMLSASILTSPRPGQNRMVLPVFGIMALTFLLIHALHLRLIAWSIRREGSR